MQTRGGSISTSLSAKLWEELEKYLAKHPEETVSTALRDGLVAYIRRDK